MSVFSAFFTCLYLRPCSLVENKSDDGFRVSLIKEFGYKLLDLPLEICICFATTWDLRTPKSYFSMQSPGNYIQCTFILTFLGFSYFVHRFYQYNFYFFLLCFIQIFKIFFFQDSPHRFFFYDIYVHFYVQKTQLFILFYDILSFLLILFL